MHSRLRGGLWLLALGVLGWSVSLRAEDEALAPVLRFQATLLAVMQEGPALGFAGRRDRLAAMVDEHFHLARITRAVIGRHYASLGPGERDALGQRIRDFAVATLASRFTRHDGEVFALPELRASRGATARARSRFVGKAGEATALDYDLVRDGGSWRIVNVWFDGVSGTDIQRAEFEVFLRAGGAARLIAKLDELVLALSREDG